MTFKTRRTTTIDGEFGAAPAPVPPPAPRTPRAPNPPTPQPAPTPTPPPSALTIGVLKTITASAIEKARARAAFNGDGGAVTLAGYLNRLVGRGSVGLRDDHAVDVATIRAIIEKGMAQARTAGEAAVVRLGDGLFRALMAEQDSAFRTVHELAAAFTRAASRATTAAHHQLAQTCSRVALLLVTDAPSGPTPVDAAPRGPSIGARSFDFSSPTEVDAFLRQTTTSNHEGETIAPHGYVVVVEAVGDITRDAWLDVFRYHRGAIGQTAEGKRRAFLLVSTRIEGADTTAASQAIALAKAAGIDARAVTGAVPPLVGERMRLVGANLIESDARTVASNRETAARARIAACTVDSSEYGQHAANLLRQATGAAPCP